jgi:HNH endonuclease
MDLSNPAQITNLIRRGLRLQLDPAPTAVERKRAFEFFGYKCAYCEAQIDLKTGHLDHLTSASQGGSNHVSNRVPSCSICNANEKRDTHWEDFLRQKCCNDATIIAIKRLRIGRWIEECGTAPLLSKSAGRVAEEEGRRLTAEYNQACRRIRDTSRNAVTGSE